MDIIKLQHPLSSNPNFHCQDNVLAMGFFDGVHLGHQEVIKAALAKGQETGLPTAVMTFNHSPKILYQRIHPDQYTYLSTLDRKLELVEALGVDKVFILDFTWAVGSMSPQDFVDQYMVDLGAKWVVAGFDYTYGKAEIANMKTLPDHAKGRFGVIEIPEYQIQEHKVGTRTIKEMLEQGDVDLANAELGYKYENTGLVINGYKRGRGLGYPTANVAIHYGQQVPGRGVYVVEIQVQGSWYKGMASIGYNVTFGMEDKLSVEVYILDFNQTIYGETVTVRWHHFLRPEVKFDSVQGLISQLDDDKQATIDYFKSLS